MGPEVMKEQLRFWGLEAPYVYGIVNDIAEGRESAEIASGRRMRVNNVDHVQFNGGR